MNKKLASKGMRFPCRPVAVTESYHLGSITLDIPLESGPNLWLENSVSFTPISPQREGELVTRNAMFSRGVSRTPWVKFSEGSIEAAWIVNASINGREERPFSAILSVIQTHPFFPSLSQLVAHTHQILRVMFMLNEVGGAPFLLAGVSGGGGSGEGVNLVTGSLLTGR